MTRHTITTAPKIAPKGWSRRRTEKVLAVEGLSISKRIDTALSGDGASARRSIRALVKSR